MLPRPINNYGDFDKPVAVLVFNCLTVFILYF